MKTKTWGLLTLSLLLLLSSCNDPCKDYDCGNGTCTDMDGEATCVCDTYFEGSKCDTEVNAKFIGTYDVNETTPQGGNINFVCVVSKGGAIDKLIFDNVAELQQDIVGTIQENGVDFILDQTTFGNGNYLNANGSISTGQIIIEGAFYNSNDTLLFSFTDTFTQQ